LSKRQGHLTFGATVVPISELHMILILFYHHHHHHRPRPTVRSIKLFRISAPFCSLYPDISSSSWSEIYRLSS